MHRLELKVPPVAVFLLIGAAMWALARTIPAAAVSLSGASFIAAALALIGGALGVSAILRFRQHETTVHPNKPEKASAVVTTGAYRYTRNPMYLGLAFLLTAWAFKLGNVLSLACVALFIAYMTRFQIKPEERALLELFGETYSDYLGRVRRWL